MTCKENRVRFGDSTFVVAVDVPLSRQDLDGLWYSRFDFQIMQAKNRHGNVSCIFEKKADRLKLNERQINHVRSIVSLQEEHRDANVIDGSGLKALSMTLSKDSCKEALENATETAMDSFQINRKSPFMTAKTATEFAKKTRFSGRRSQSHSSIRTTVACPRSHPSSAAMRKSKSDRTTSALHRQNAHKDIIDMRNYTYPKKIGAKLA